MIAAQSIVMVTSRQPNDSLYSDLLEFDYNQNLSRPKSIRRIGDCDAPAIIAAAVFAGHRYARELESNTDSAHTEMKYDRVFFEDLDKPAENSIGD